MKQILLSIREFLFDFMLIYIGPVLTLFIMFIGVFVIVVMIYAISGIECRGYENRNIYHESFIKRCLL